MRSCAKSVLPGIGPHLGPLCDLELEGAALLPCDPIGRRFRLPDTSEDCLAAAGVISGLILWGLSIAGVIALVWDALTFTIPCHVRRMVTDLETYNALAAVRTGTGKMADKLYGHAQGPAGCDPVCQGVGR